MCPTFAYKQQSSQSIPNLLTLFTVRNLTLIYITLSQMTHESGNALQIRMKLIPSSRSSTLLRSQHAVYQSIAMQWHLSTANGTMGDLADSSEFHSSRLLLIDHLAQSLTTTFTCFTSSWITQQTTEHQSYDQQFQAILLRTTCYQCFCCTPYAQL